MIGRIPHFSPASSGKCITRRCGLCKFRFVDGDVVVVVKPDDETTDHFRYSIGVKVHDGVDTYLICRGACSHQEGQVFGCHADCFKFSCSKSHDELFQAVGYGFEPPRCQQRRRRRWLHSSLTERLGVQSRGTGKMAEALGVSSMPWDVRAEIGQHLIREYAAVTASSVRPRPRRVSPSVSLSEEVWARYVEYEGVKYISSLTDEPRRNEPWERLSPEKEEVQTLYMCHDHLGIRRLILSSSNQVPAVEWTPDAWWKTFAISNSRTKLGYQTDGIKLRELTFSEDASIGNAYPNMSWATPQRHRRFRFHKFCRDLLFKSPPPRMAMFGYNDDTTNAYSACFNPDATILHSHSPGEDLSFYQEISNEAIWVHAPMDMDEKVTELWMRNAYGFNRGQGFLMKTTKGRVHLFGHQPGPTISNCTWTLLDTPGGRPARFFFDCSSPYGIRSLAFSSGQPDSGGQELVVPAPLSPYPPSTSLAEDYFYSSASLVNVREIIPCTHELRGDMLVVGMLLRYEDGTLGRVGQVRLDCLRELVLVDPTEKLWIGIGLTKDGLPNVFGVENRMPRAKGEMEWIDASWDGTLEWWFSTRQAVVCHRGRALPAPLVP